MDRIFSSDNEPNQKVLDNIYKKAKNSTTLAEEKNAFDEYIEYLEYSINYTKLHPNTVNIIDHRTYHY